MNWTPELLWSALALMGAGVTALIALLSAAETALATASRGEIRQSDAAGTSSAQRLERILADPIRFLVAFILARFLLLIGAGMGLMGMLTWLEIEPGGQAGAGVLSVLVVAVAHIWGRAWSLRDATRAALRFSRFAQGVMYGLIPVVWVLLRLSNRVQGENGQNAPEDIRTLSVEGLQFLIDMNEEKTEIAESEKDMMASVVELRGTPVREVMVPRIDMVSIQADLPLPEALEIVVKAGHSRVPVYSDNVDAIEGILYAKDILALFQERRANMPLREIIREPYFVPASKKLDAMFREFQAHRIHIAIVVDEFGGTAGLVTMEDLVEEIFGEIQDEYDQEQREMRKISDDEYEFNARYDLDDASRILESPLPVDLADTVGGFIFNQLGRVPVRHDQVEFGHWRFEVSVIEDSRIKTVHARRLARTPAA